jgi:hypothetical protein
MTVAAATSVRVSVLVQAAPHAKQIKFDNQPKGFYFL